MSDIDRKCTRALLQVISAGSSTSLSDRFVISGRSGNLKSWNCHSKLQRAIRKRKEDLNLYVCQDELRVLSVFVFCAFLLTVESDLFTRYGDE